MEHNHIGMKEVVSRLPIPLPKSCLYRMAGAGLFPPVLIKNRGSIETKWDRDQVETYFNLIKNSSSHEEIILFIESITELTEEI